MAQKRRGVSTVPLYSNVQADTKAAIDRIAEATGARKNVVIEQIVANVDLDEQGIPTWWPATIAEDQEELPLTG